MACSPWGATPWPWGISPPWRRGWRVCDLGTGSGALLLLLARRAPGLILSAIERDPLAAQTARDNLAQNNLTGEVITGDLRNRLLPAEQFDLVVSNPPYFQVNSGGSGGPARSEEFCTLDQLCAAAGYLVKNGGRFALCHRPERLADIICSLRAHGLEPQAPDPSLPQSKPRPLPPPGGGGETGQAGGGSADSVSVGLTVLLPQALHMLRKTPHNGGQGAPPAQDKAHLAVLGLVKLLCHDLIGHPLQCQIRQHADA